MYHTRMFAANQTERSYQYQLNRLRWMVHFARLESRHLMKQLFLIIQRHSKSAH